MLCMREMSVDELRGICLTCDQCDRKKETVTMKASDGPVVFPFYCLGEVEESNSSVHACHCVCLKLKISFCPEANV